MQDRNKRIVLVGYMYCGKSTVGRKLAKKLKYKFYDIDDEIENKFHYTISNIFKTFGEDFFRQQEKVMIDELLKKDNVVIACGGGTPCFFDTMQKIKQSSLSIYLYMNEKQIFSRYKNSKNGRVMFENKSDEQVQQLIYDTLKIRQQYYNQADITINAFDILPYDIVAKINDFIVE